MRGAGARRRADEPADEPAAVAVHHAGHHQNWVPATTGPPKDSPFVPAPPRRHAWRGLRCRLIDRAVGVPVDPDAAGMHVGPRPKAILHRGGRLQVNVRSVGPVVLSQLNRRINVERRLVKHVKVGEAASHDGGTQRGDAWSASSLRASATAWCPCRCSARIVARPR